MTLLTDLLWPQSQVQAACQGVIRFACLVSAMGDEPLQHVIDVARHGGTETLSEPISKPKIGGSFVLDENVIQGIYLAFP